MKNSILKAVSGGPIYISDELERSVRDVIMPLVLSNGRILRCDRPGMPTVDCLTNNPTESGRVFKIQNICDSSGVIAVFNFDNDGKSVKGTVSPDDVCGIDGDEFVLYEHFSGEYTILKKGEKIDITLNNQDDYKLYTVVPVTDGFAPIGRIDKFISPKTIKAVVGETIELYEKGEYAYVKDGKLHISSK